MLSTEKQLERLDYMRQAAEYIVPAFREFEAKGLRVELAFDPARESVGEHITIHVHTPAERSDGQRLADLLGWTETGQTFVRDSIHYRWFGVVKGFRARLLVVESRRDARDTQGRDPLPKGVGVGERPAVRLPVPLGGVVQPGSQFADRPADTDMPPAPQTRSPHELGCTVAAPCSECRPRPV